MLQNPRTKGPGEAPKEALERHLKEAKHPLRLTLRNFTLGEVYRNRTDLTKTPLTRPPERPLRGSAIKQAGK